MSLMKCRGCGGQVHHAARRCPHCGCPDPNPALHTASMVITIIAVVIFTMAFLFVVSQFGSRPRFAGPAGQPIPLNLR